MNILLIILMLFFINLNIFFLRKEVNFLNKIDLKNYISFIVSVNIITIFTFSILYLSNTNYTISLIILYLMLLLRIFKLINIKYYDKSKNKFYLIIVISIILKYALFK